MVVEDIGWERPHYGCRQMLLAMVGILVGLVLCVSVVVVAVDVSCVSQAETWIPRYPNATKVDEVYNFIRPFGMGITLVVLETPDSAQEVRNGTVIIVGTWHGHKRKGMRVWIGVSPLR